MYNPIQVAIARVFSNIPQRLLEESFRKYSHLGPIDQVIVQKIIQGKVAVDCNLVGGKVKDIPLLLDYHESTSWGIPEANLNEGRYSLYRVPPEVRDNLPMVSVSHVTYPRNLAGNPLGIQANDGNYLSDMVDQVLESHTFSRSYVSPMAEIMAGDLIRLNPAQNNHIDWIVTVKLTYDVDFSNLNQSAVLSFAKLVELATKAYIYNELIIDLDRVAMVSGTQLGSIKQIVDGYVDASKEYDEMLEVNFTGGATLDPKRLATIYSHMI